MTKKNKREYRYLDSNYLSRIKTGQMKKECGLRTCTINRDDGALNVSVVTRNEGGTTVKIYRDEELFADLNGHEARTIFRVLQKHFEYK